MKWHSGGPNFGRGSSFGQPEGNVEEIILIIGRQSHKITVFHFFFLHFIDSFLDLYDSTMYFSTTSHDIFFPTNPLLPCRLPNFRTQRWCRSIEMWFLIILSLHLLAAKRQPSPPPSRPALCLQPLSSLPIASRSSICTHHMFVRRRTQLLNRLSAWTKNNTPVRSAQRLILPLHIRLVRLGWPPRFSTRQSRTPEVNADGGTRIWLSFFVAGSSPPALLPVLPVEFIKGSIMQNQPAGREETLPIICIWL